MWSYHTAPDSGFLGFSISKNPKNPETQNLTHLELSHDSGSLLGTEEYEEGSL